MEPEGSIALLQVPATSLHSEPDQSSPCLPSHFLKIHLNIILRFTPASSEWSLSFRFPHQTPAYTSLHIRATWTDHLILLDLITLIILGEEYISLSFSLCSFPHSPVASSLLGPNILKQNYSSVSLNLYIFG